MKPLLNIRFFSIKYVGKFGGLKIHSNFELKQLQSIYWSLKITTRIDIYVVLISTNALFFVSDVELC